MGSTASVIVAASSAISVIGSTYTQSRAIKSQGAYEQQVANSNARMAELQSEDAIRRGETEAQNYSFQVKKLLGSQRARLAAQGLDLGFGSASDVLQDTARFGALDTLTIRNNATREALGYQIQASEYRSQGAFAKITASQKRAQTILTGGMQLANVGASYAGQLSSLSAPRVPTTHGSAGYHGAGYANYPSLYKTLYG